MSCVDALRIACTDLNGVVYAVLPRITIAASFSICVQVAVFRDAGCGVTGERLCGLKAAIRTRAPFFNILNGVLDPTL